MRQPQASATKQCSGQEAADSPWEGRPPRTAEGVGLVATETLGEGVRIDVGSLLHARPKGSTPHVNCLELCVVSDVAGVV